MKRRLFFGVPCPPLPAICQIQGELAACLPGVRLIPLQNLHLTLRFLGAVEDSQIPALCSHVRPLLCDLSHEDMVLSGVGRFPGVLWIGVTLSARIHALVHTLNASLGELGLPGPDQPFRPHVTVARVKKGGEGAVFDRLARGYGNVHFGTVLLDAVHLYSSESCRDGVRYTALETFK